MFFKLVAVLLVSLAAAEDLSFTYNGFQSVNLSLDGLAGVTPNGLLRLTNGTKQNQGHAFYPNPVNFKSSPNGTAFSFSSTFVFAIRSEYADLSGHGIVFVVAPTRGLPGALPSQYLGLFNEGNDGNATNHVFAVELDTIQSKEFNDINDNHVGIDINGLHSATSTTAGYYAQNNGGFQNLTLISGQPMQVWVDYDGTKKQINVTMAPINVDKPQFSLLSLNRDLSPILNETMYVGFSSSTGSVRTSHYVLGWSFKMNGQAQEIVTSKLPKLPRMGEGRGSLQNYLKIGSLSMGLKVYRGILPSSKIEIAVKRVSHESRQGMKEFIAEVVSIGRLRHRNLVPLLGYCRRKGELLLVYDYMSNGSLDKYLYDQPVVTLNWSQRFRVIRGVASGLFYLHEGWEQVVIHRDVKASNVLLDGELNARLGDFGLARLYDHGTDPQTTHIVGTLGYLAPEHTRSGRATTSTDVFAFGAFVLEVACGRRPIEAHGPDQDLILVDWVFSFWNRGAILEARDQNLSSEFVAEEVELVLKLGLLCSHSEPTVRPSMRQVVQYLEGDIALPELSLLGLSSNGLTFAHHEGFDDFAMSYSSSLGKGFSHSSHAPESAFLSGGR
ncbi:L-type lectin-domain containing receptor kinase IV.1-like [Prunus yedoensis var. nudiflora]|uniref:non-specific serine/threonine protein kinase n=1 Tax=Prunus yedoensis var. nudiflora TaxID=2094558 RepID=A0A314Z2M4_PRUYE|nr:L-type lectin-domain containing receptor kinase IV.1-like [Prunus yedoensis var. nudiflora]